MKIQSLLFYLAGWSLFIFSSCIKEVPTNIEADIVTATIEKDTLLEAPPIISNNTVTFVLKNADAGSFTFAPEFELSAGATVVPKSGTALDFSQSRQYTVTSESGEWTKNYKVSFKIASRDTLMSFSFEKADTVNTSNPEGHYERFYHLDEKADTIRSWSSGNPGFNILAAMLVPTGEELTPDFYPTAQTTKGYIGNGVVLQTKATGSLGASFGSPLAAGNLFIGTFQLTFPSINSTRFGLPYNHKFAPKALKGYFKYKAGEHFIINNKPSQLTKDTWNAYAILFEKEAGEKDYLNTTDIFDNPRIVSIAQLDADQRIETSTWTKFSIPFKMVDGKSFDANQDYFYTIVFTSSKEGDQFNGAEGSTLYVDEVQLVTIN